MGILTGRSRLFGSSALAGAALLSAGGATAVAAERDEPLKPVLAAVSLGDGGGVQALATGAPASSEPAPQEVVVTGSRIRSPSLTSTSPLTVVGSQDFTNIGATSVEEVLNELPSVVSDQNANLSGLSNGTATVDLRDLGATRTLVLVDGKRLMPGDPTSPVADLNTIPSPLVERVEVVTGGASAVYGSDAVAGVVNFIMKKNFQGVRIEATDNFANHTNGDKAAQGFISDSGFVQAPSGNNTFQLGEQVSGIIGVNAPDDRGNITAYATYRHLQPILESKYDYSACTISAAASDAAHYNAGIYDTHACGGSSNGLYGKFVPTLASEALGGTTKTLHDNPNGSQAFVNTGVPSYNYGATNYFQRSETRYTAGFFGHYDISKSLEVYSDFMFADDQTVGQIAPSGLFAGTGANGASTYNINCNNPLLTAAQQSQLCGAAAGTAAQVAYQIGYRFASFPRDYGFQHTSYKIDIGAKGTLADGWTYDAYLQYGTSILSNLLLNDVSTQHVQNALLVNPVTGQCFTGGSACVPLNVFKAGGVTRAAFNYVAAPGIQTGDTVEQVASASLTGDLGQYGVKSPFAADGVGVAFGTEYRRESLTFTPDSEYQSADLSGTSPAYPSSGVFDVYELFAEARIPLVQNAPFTKDLSADIGYRFSDYSTAGKTDTYKLQLEYAPTADIRFRGGYNRAVRAPNVVELFKSSTVNLFGGTDPCVGTTPGASLAACVATGLPASQYGQFTSGCPAGQCSVLNSGTATLKPETSDTYTAGFVLTPTMSWARGFSMSVDYFNITVYNLITSIAPSVFTSECAAGNLAVCSSTFKRDPQTFTIYGQQGYIISPNTNSGYLRTHGIDVEANYRKHLSDFGLPDWGVMSFNFVGTWTEKLSTQPVSRGPTYDCAGLFGLTCGTPLPHFKAKFRATYTPRAWPLSVSAQVRYVGNTRLDANTTNPLLMAHPYGLTDTKDNSIVPYTYLDLNIQWHVRDNLTLNAGVNNVLDKDPPIVDSGIFVGAGAAAGNGNTYPGTYDALGRTLFVTLTADF